ncbi:MAG: nucleotide pyrophosphohydrolase [Candidatus Marsarchaeota archaeon]|nr:nucleotide pyrophosphohydrolase [Candidatus Marsarchaeota archaeon]MCL5095015.1 nucleotide pyrophosphohydrolase [Candidatus Marsarchaeota archaeon]
MKDNKTNIKELKDMVQKFCEDRDWDQFHNPKDLAIGISTEANELLDLFRFKSDAEINEIMQDYKKREKIGEELSDIFYMALRFAQKFDFDISNELEEKMKKNMAKYPIEKARGSNKKYNEF